MARERPPAFDLDCIDLRQPPAQIIPAIPLKPPTRIGPVNPSLLAPDAQGLPALDTEIVERRIGGIGKLRVLEPLGGKLRAAIVAILALEHAHLEHFARRIERLEAGIETFAGRRDQLVAIAGLHAVVDFDDVAGGHGRAVEGFGVGVKGGGCLVGLRRKR